MATTLSTMEATRAHVCNNNKNNNNNAPPVSFMTTTRWHHFLLAHSRAYRELHAERERGWTVSALDTWYAMRRKVTATTTTTATTAATSSSNSSNDNSTRADVTTTTNTTTATTAATTVTSAFAHIDVGVLSERYRAHMRRLARDTAPHFFRRRQAHTQQQQQTIQEQQQQQQHGHHHHHNDDNTNSNACDDVCVDFLDLGCAPGGVSKYLTIDLQWCGVGVTLPLRDGGVGVDAALTATALHERYALLEGNVAADVSTWRCYEAAAVTAAAAGDDVASSSAAASVSHTRNTHASCVTPLQRRMLAQLQQQHKQHQQQQQQTQPSSSSSSASSASSACRFAFVNGGAVRDFGQRYSRMLQRCSSNYDKHNNNNTATASSCSDATTTMTSLLRRPRCDRDGDGRVRSDTATTTTTWHDEQHALPRRRTTCNVLDTAADDVCATHTSDKRDNNDGDCNNNNNTDRDDMSGDIFDGDDSVQDILPWLNLFVPQLRLALAHVADGGSMMLVYGLPQCASFFILLYALDAIVGEAHAYDDDNNNRRRTRASPTRVHVYETIHVTKSPVYVLWTGVHTPQQAAPQQRQQDDDRDDEEDEVVVQDTQRRAEAQAQLFAALDATSTTLLPVPIARLPASIAASTATTTADTSIQGDGQQQQQQRDGGVVQTMLSDDTPHAARVRAKRQLWMGESDVGFALAQAGFARHRRAIEAVWERARSCLCARRQRAEREVAALTSHGAVGL